ncbi:VIR protein [Plasmodium vivax]|uniref:VIR protein n=1 Tax=Plasmodium vivax TaxID=5855 RepID=A0A1G4E591_PLAVI|nr:VIR protein [Plasmodium vivax]
MLCNSIGPRYGNDERAFISDCPQVAKYIQDIYTTCPVEDKTDRCKYLNYYINYIVKNNSNKNYSVEELIKAYGRLANKLNMCNDSIKVIEESVFKNIEELSNIYYEFNKYINTINTYQTNDCPDLPQSVQLYLNKENTCEGDKNIFCAAVDKFKNYYLSKIKQAKCKNVKYNLESFLSLDNTEIVNNEEEGRQARAKVVEHVTGDRGTEVTATSIHSELDVGDNHDEPSNHNASNPVRTITYTSLGLVLPLATLYRLTPLGSWVNTKILGKNKLMDNMKRNHYELLLNDVRNGEMSLNDTTYSISYNSAAK